MLVHPTTSALTHYARKHQTRQLPRNIINEEIMSLLKIEDLKVNIFAIYKNGRYIYKNISLIYKHTD
ncbi:MAG: hypothetical protein LBF23_02190 [Endomicrobium sp.]|nr:hypothetical protein [Endomicrobium sp.]